MPRNSRVIDHFGNGTATSIKSIDLNAATYQDAGRLTYRINDYIRKLADFDGGTYGETDIAENDIKSRELNVVVPKGGMTSMQKATINSAVKRANTLGITLKITQL